MAWIHELKSEEQIQITTTSGEVIEIALASRGAKPILVIQAEQKAAEIEIKSAHTTQ